MFNVVLESSELDKLLKKQKGFGVTIPLKQAAEYQLRSTKLNFLAQSDPDGNKWSPLKPSTIARKGFSTILIDKRDMYLGNEVNFSSDGVTIQNKRPYAIYHQTGTATMPQRRFMGFSSKDIKELTRIFSEYTRKYFGS